MSTTTFSLSLVAICALSLAAGSARSQAASTGDVREVGPRLELFVDDWLIERMDGATLQLHHPEPREVAFAFDQPWEGDTCGGVSVFQDGDLYRMYYRGSAWDWTRNRQQYELVCYAESTDGIHWTKPDLGLYEWQGNTHNAIVWPGPEGITFAAFKDTNPAAAPDARYKALGGVPPYAFGSPDGLHWRKLKEDGPVLSDPSPNAFDSHNQAFFGELRGEYVAYFRAARKPLEEGGFREFRVCTSKDFLHWSEAQFLDFGDAPQEHLYTSAITPYPRAPHLYLGFPMRFVPERKAIADHPFPGVSDGVFMTSRDGLHWHRYLEAFIRPGLERDRWVERANMAAFGLVVTHAETPGLPDELSLYANEGHYEPRDRLRRYMLRLDGFVSVSASASGGEMLTRPLTFTGKELVVNYSTSAAGSLRVEVMDVAGQAIAGFALGDCPGMYGDSVEQVVQWRGGPDLSRLSGQPVRLRFELHDADLCSIRFRP